LSIKSGREPQDRECIKRNDHRSNNKDVPMLKKFALFAAAVLVSSGSGMAAEPQISDAQIAHIAYTAGQLDVDTAKLALERSTDANIRAFAETMVRDHEAVNKQALALVARLGVTPEANATSSNLSTDAAAARRQLASLNGKAFDRAYAQREAAYHAAVNKALSSTLIPAAQNPELKELLQQGLTLFQAHQQHAEALAKSLR
jgi:putative membrane protein